MPHGELSTGQDSGGHRHVNSRRRTIRSAALATAIAAIGAAALTAGMARPGTAGVEGRAPRPGGREATGRPRPRGPVQQAAGAQRKRRSSRCSPGTPRPSKRGGSQVVKLDKGKYVELGREKTDKIFTILVEFGDKVDDTTMYDPDGDGPEAAGQEVRRRPRPGAQPDSRAGPRRGQQHGLAEGLQPAALPGPVLLARTRTSSP